MSSEWKPCANKECKGIALIPDSEYCNSCAPKNGFNEMEEMVTLASVMVEDIDFYLDCEDYDSLFNVAMALNQLSNDIAKKAKESSQEV